MQYMIFDSVFKVIFKSCRLHFEQNDLNRVAEVAREHGWHPPKSLSQIKICRDLRTFWRSLGKKSAFLGQKRCFLGKKCSIT